jgi:hypothetical protein
VTLEIISQGKERVRHGIDWTVRAHPTIAAGIAGAAITVAGAYVALDADNDPGDVIAGRPPAAAGPAPAQPQAQGRQNERELARPQVPSAGASDGSGAPERAPRAGGPFAAPDRSDGGSSGAGGTSASSGGGSTGGDSSGSGSSGSSSGSSGSSGGGSGDSGGGGSEPAPAPPPDSGSPSQPSQPPQPEPKCVLRVDLLGNVVKVCL